NVPSGMVINSNGGITFKEKANGTFGPTKKVNSSTVPKSGQRSYASQQIGNITNNRCYSAYRGSATRESSAKNVSRYKESGDYYKAENIAISSCIINGTPAIDYVENTIINHKAAAITFEDVRVSTPKASNSGHNTNIKESTYAQKDIEVSAFHCI